MQWAQRQRLQFIEHRLYWEGRINRGDIAEAFGVSMVQASIDLGAYRGQFPDNAVYDTSNKVYLPSPHFAPGLIQPSPDQLLRSLAATGTTAEIMPLPERTINPGILRPVLRAVTERTPLRITYQSLSRPQPLPRIILPHTLISDHKRWHVRGYCTVAGGFRDFLLARILEASADETVQGLQGPDADVFWNRKVPVELAPHPGLTPDQQVVIARDYAMTNGEMVMLLRQAYLPYFLRRLNLVAATDHPQEQQLMVRNRADVDRWYREVMPVKREGEVA